MILRIEKADSAAARTIMAALNADLAGRYPGKPIFGIDAARFEAEGGVFALGYEASEPVASGALRRYETAAEIKRVFVAPRWRGRGLARRMMAFLEAQAMQRGYRRAVLETGSGQPEAISLYRSLGWSEIPPFGIFALEQNGACCNAPGDFRHVCFEKTLRNEGPCSLVE